MAYKRIGKSALSGVLAVSLGLYGSSLFGQEKQDTTKKSGTIDQVVEQQHPVIKFVPYDTPPHPIGGFAALQKNVVYPDSAKKAGIAGIVLVQAQIGAEGDVLETMVMSSPFGYGLEESAMNAVKNVKWEPAKQKDRSVEVWIVIPINYKLD